MKILHVIESLGAGGAERLLVTLLPELSRRGDDVTVAVLRPPLELSTQLELAGVPVVLLPRRAKWNLLGLAMEIARCAREHECDVVHAHLYFPAVASALARILRLHPGASVVTFHNLAYQPGVNKPGLGLRCRKVLARLLYPRGFDRMLAVSEAVASHYGEHLALAHIGVLHNAIDLSLIDAIARGAPSVQVAGHVVLPGRLVPEKGHADFLHAVSELYRAGRPLRVTLAGDGPLRAAVHAQIEKLGLSGIVTITGHLPYPALMGVVGSAEVVVTPSRAEGFGLTAAEAMALSRPVVACAVGGLMEVVRDGESGLLVPPKAPAALAAAIARLLDDPALRLRLAHEGRVRVEECFSLAAVADRLRAVYAGVMLQRTGAPATIS